MHALAAPFARGYLDAFTLCAPDLPAWTALLERGAPPEQYAAWEPLIAAYRTSLASTSDLPPVPTAFLHAITSGMAEAERMAITTTVGKRWWWGAAALDPLPNYGIQGMLLPIFLQQTRTLFMKAPSIVHDALVRQWVWFVQEVMRVPLRSIHDRTPPREWWIDIHIATCPFCAHPNGCGVWYGMVCAATDWMLRRPHPEWSAEGMIRVCQLDAHGHHLRCILTGVPRTERTG